MSSTVEFVIIGSGVNGLVAAAELALAGRSVMVIERNESIGGFIASGERTVPGYIHDTYSSWHPLFVASAGYGVLGAELHRHGLEYCNTDDAVTASISDGGQVSIAYRDVERTVAGFEHDADKVAYRKMLAELGGRADVVFGALGAELRSAALVKLGLKLLRREKISGSEAFVRDAVTSGRSYVRGAFIGREADQLWSPWLLHAGLSPDHASGGLMFPVMAMTMHNFGLPVVQGGAANFIGAFSRLFAEHGVQTRLGAAVDQIIVRNGKAVGVRVAGEVVLASQAVIASVTPQALYDTLLPDTAVKPDVRDQAQRYRYGRGAMQIHVALDRPPAWTDARLGEVPLIHVSDGASSTGIACAQAEAGLLPSAPTIVVGQQYLLDPARAPEGAATLWLQLQEVPYTPVGDAGGTLDTTGGWTPELARAYAERALARLEQFAPGLRASMLGIDVISPVDLEAANPNAVEGDPYGGSAELDQNLLWRPLRSAARHRTSVAGLWHIGSSTHPGPGLGAGSGHLVAQSLVRSRAR